MRKLFSAICALTLAFGLILPVSAEGEDGFVSSVVQEGVKPVGPGQIVDPDGKVVGSIGVVLGDKPVKDQTEEWPFIIITPLEWCKYYVNKYDQTSTASIIKNKLREELENGIEYNSGIATVMLYDAVIESGSVTSFLDIFGSSAVAAAKQQAVAPLDEYQPLTVFDVSITDTAIQHIGSPQPITGSNTAYNQTDEGFSYLSNFFSELDVSFTTSILDKIGGNYVTISVSIPGVDSNKDLIVLGFKGEMNSLSQNVLADVTGKDAVNAVKNMSVQALGYSVNQSGDLSVTVPYFCEVMVLVKDKTGTAAGENSGSESTNTSTHTGQPLWIALLSGSVIMLGILIIKKRKLAR